MCLLNYSEKNNLWHFNADIEFHLTWFIMKNPKDPWKKPTWSSANGSYFCCNYNAGSNKLGLPNALI